MDKSKAYKLGVIVGEIIVILFAVVVLSFIIANWRWALGLVGIIVLLLFIIEMAKPKKGEDDGST